MSLKCLVDVKYIPDDGCWENIEAFEKNTGADILVFPDVHMKKGSMIANGMLISTDYSIFLSCLGVENCGFTFGKILNCNEDMLIKSFSVYSKILRERTQLPKYSEVEVLNIFDGYLKQDYEKKSFLYGYLGFKDLDSLLKEAHLILNQRLLRVASNSLCTLGGGNHFFEIHKVIETFDTDIVTKGDFIYMLHSDSIAIGDIIYELYSDLHEMKHTGSLREKYRVTKFKCYQNKYFKNLCRSVGGIKEDLHLIFNPKSDYQTIDIRTSLGRNLMLAHNLSSIFGEMNRDAIIENWAKCQKIKQVKLGSHSHDNVTAELYQDQVKIIHRNGVQNIGIDEYCILPSAMGNFSFLMRNSHNENAYFSTNHGTGRMQDKHIARTYYSEQNTIDEMKQKKVSLFRVGNGNLAEQNMHAFKEPTAIVEEMERNNLAKRAAKTYPIAVIKG